MLENRNMRRCDICGSEFQWGPQRYDGQDIPRYQMIVCMPCYKGNWDGWAPHREKKLEEHLAQKGLPLPERNARGWFPRD